MNHSALAGFLIVLCFCLSFVFGITLGLVAHVMEGYTQLPPIPSNPPELPPAPLDEPQIGGPYR